MIFCSVINQLSNFNASKYVFEQSAMRYDLRDQGSVVLEQTATTGKQVNKVRSTFSWKQPYDISGQMTVQGETKEFYVDKFKSVTYRRDLNQYIENLKDEKISLRDAALIAESRFESIPLAFSQPGETAKYFETYAKLPNWKVTVKDGLIHLTTSINNIFYQFDFRARDYALVYQSLKEGTVRQEWRLSDGPGLKRFSPAAKAGRVLAFALPPKEPTYADKNARLVTRKMFEAYDRPTWLAFEVSDQGKKTKVLLKGTKMRQVDGQADFAYDGKVGAVWNKADNTYFEGRVKSSQLRGVIAEADTRFDPMVAKLVEGTNYFRDLLGQGAKVRVSMTMKDRSGQPVTLLEAKMPGTTYNIAVRNSDGKVLSLMSGLEGRGETVSSQRVFEYLPKSSVESDAAFKVIPPSNAKRVTIKDVVAMN